MKKQVNVKKKSVCPKGESYNIEKKKCEKVCEEGEIYMKEENKCKNICKEGERTL